jgi:hypothetical protein
MKFFTCDTLELRILQSIREKVACSLLEARAGARISKMPLTADSPSYLHILQNASLIFLAVLCIPISTITLVICILVTYASDFTRNLFPQWNIQDLASPCSDSKTVLVTGVGMAKGLFIARAFHQSGHTVIGADFEPHGIPVCGRFSTALKKFHRLPKPTTSKDGSTNYTRKLIEIVKQEKIDLWVSCSGVMSAVEDGEAAEAIERYTKCKAVQFGTSLTKTLHEKHSFIENTKKLGLNVPETHLVTSITEAMDFLHPELQGRQNGRKYILKSVGVDDSIRADMTLLPLSIAHTTRKHLSQFRPSTSRPFVLQQFISGPEYCTHSIVIRGRVLAFTGCRSAELLMHYRALSPKDELFKAMLEYTQAYVERMDEKMTGHFSIDFLVDKGDRVKSQSERIYPIECNPRAHTAVVNYSGRTEMMVQAYLSALSENPENEGKINPWVPSSTPTHYWIGHDIVTRGLLPLLFFVTRKAALIEVLRGWRELLEHLIYWRDPTYEIRDPLPAWWSYCVYWPSMFLVAILKRKWWSRCNVSTGKIFGC